MRQGARDGTLVLGGGCAGLSLATRLAARGLPVTVIEPRAGYSEDRLWSYWRPRGTPGPFSFCRRALWDRWRVTAPGAEGATRGGAGLVYETIGAGAFYAAAEHALDAAPGARLHLATRATGEPHRRADGLWQVETDRGPCLGAYLVDTRPGGPAPAYGQHFLGAEIRVDGAVFDPATVDLMRFETPRAEGVDFVYVLPFARDRALVEVTRFADRAPPRAEMRRWLAGAVSARAQGRAVETLREEAATLPMTASAGPRPRPSSRVDLGLRGGAARASTGYAFQRIQRRAEAVARQIAAGEPALVPPRDGPATRAMDAHFLKVIDRHPERGPALFAAMFAHAPPDRLERFLSGSTAPRDRLSVVSALPTGLFLGELVRP